MAWGSSVALVFAVALRPAAGLGLMHRGEGHGVPNATRPAGLQLPATGRRVFDSVTWSNTAMGVIVQRWWLWHTTAMDELWPDACFMSMTRGKLSPSAEELRAIKTSECQCHSNLVSRQETFGQEDLIQRTSFANREVKSRTLCINSVLRTLVPPMGPDAQVVNLGAGFDARMYSLRALENATLFEFDVADTQELKRTLVDRCHLIPVNGKEVHMLPLNLETDQDVYSRLFEHPAFNASKPTIFLSEAVAQYVNEEANARAFRRISEVARQNNQSRLVFMSWQFKDAFSPEVMGDAVKFGVPPNETGLAWFRKIGWEQDLPKAVAKAKDNFDNARVPYNYFNVFKATAAR